MQFREFLGVLRARWRALVACLLLVLAATSWVTLSTPPVYKATARVFFAVDKGADVTGNTLASQDLRTYADLLGSPVVRDPLRATLGLPAGTPVQVSAAISEDTPVLEITARSSSPELAAQIANAAGPELAKVGGDYSALLVSTGQNVTSRAISPATIPTSPESPDVQRNLALGLLAGLALGIGVVLLRQFLDTRVRSEADLRPLSDRPVLASLRRLKDPETNALIVETEPHSIAAEEFRRLRTNIQFVDVTTEDQHSFVITSAVAGEGKTTASVNLALAMADSGARVLLVDADLRHPSVANALGLEGSAGLTTLLLGRASLDDVAQQWGTTSLYVLPAGEVPPNPSELLGSKAMQRLFHQLLSDYDFVLVDSPPIVPVIDPVLISRLVGGMLMVVSVDRTLKRDVASALKALKTARVEVSGFALNLVQGGDASDRYGYYHAYGHDQRRARAKPRQRTSPTGGAPEAAPDTRTDVVVGAVPDDGRRFKLGS